MMCMNDYSTLYTRGGGGLEFDLGRDVPRKGHHTCFDFFLYANVCDIMDNCVCFYNRTLFHHILHISFKGL